MKAGAETPVGLRQSFRGKFPASRLHAEPNADRFPFPTVQQPGFGLAIPIVLVGIAGA